MFSYRLNDSECKSEIDGNQFFTKRFGCKIGSFSARDLAFCCVGCGAFMTWHCSQKLIRDLRFAAIDFESAGRIRGQTDVAVQIGIASWSWEKGWQEGFMSYLHCPHEVTWQASRIHGITSKDLMGAPRLINLWPEVRSRLQGAVIVAHAHGTEKKFLRTFPGHGFAPWVDTLVWARRIWSNLPNYTLESVCQHAQVVHEINGICTTSRWHDALYDATASLCLLRHMILSQNLLDSPVDVLLQDEQ